MSWSDARIAEMAPQILLPIPPLPERCFHEAGGCERCEDRRGVSPGPIYRYVEPEGEQG